MVENTGDYGSLIDYGDVDWIEGGDKISPGVDTAGYIFLASRLGIHERVREILGSKVRYIGSIAPRRAEEGYSTQIFIDTQMSKIGSRNIEVFIYSTCPEEKKFQRFKLLGSFTKKGRSIELGDLRILAHNGKKYQKGRFDFYGLAQFMREKLPEYILEEKTVS